MRTDESSKSHSLLLDHLLSCTLKRSHQLWTCSKLQWQFHTFAEQPFSSYLCKTASYTPWSRDRLLSTVFLHSGEQVWYKFVPGTGRRPHNPSYTMWMSSTNSTGHQLRMRSRNKHVFGNHWYISKKCYYTCLKVMHGLLKTYSIYNLMMQDSPLWQQDFCGTSYL